MSRIFSAIKAGLTFVLMITAYYFVCEFTGTLVLETYGNSTLLDGLLLISVFAFWFVAFITSSFFLSDRRYSWQNCHAW